MKYFRLLLGALIVTTALVVVLFSVKIPNESPLPQVRALWVTRFDYTTSQDVQKIINNVGEAGFTDVFFQVRGNGTTFYPSTLEPWAYELSGNDVSLLGSDPGWDPLQLAIDTAQSHTLRVHAYINVLPGWKGSKEPLTTSRQLWTEHPDWFMVDSLGQKMLPTAGWYSFVNPVIPEVRQHLRGIVSELCRYDLAGIHLDYIRYPHDYHLVADEHYPDADDKELMRHADFSYDSTSQGVLFEKYGWDVSQKEIKQFRCDSVTRVVRDISYVMQREKPEGCLLTASVMGNPVEGKSRAFQDSGLWARQGLVDWVVQMNYGTKSFDRHLVAMKKAVGKKTFKTAVVVGIYCKNDLDQMIEQVKIVNASGCRGLAVFSYSLLFDEDHHPKEKGRMLLQQIRP
ncbi:MAG: family 10 glycosylhydrolase [Pontiella sp.]